MPSSCLGVGCCVGSYTRCCRHVKESHRKTTKLAGSTRRHDFPIPIDFPTACIPVVLSYLFAYSHNLTHSCISSHPILPYCPQAPKNPTSNQTRPAFPAPQTRHPRVSANSLRRLPARCRMSRRGTNPAEASGRSTQIHASNRPHHLPCASAAGPLKCASGQLLKFPAPTRGAWARRRFAMRRRHRQGSRHVMVRPVARIPGESGQTGRGKNPQARRRIAQDGWQITQAAGQTGRHAGDWVRSFHFSTFSGIS